MKRAQFFATKDDLLLILNQLEDKIKVKYTRADKLKGPRPEIWIGGTLLPQLGKATADQHSACDSFLILEWNAEINVESSVMFNGEKRFDVGQRMNQDSVVFCPGGEWIDGTLISGSITTFSSSPPRRS